MHDSTVFYFHVLFKNQRLYMTSVDINDIVFIPRWGGMVMRYIDYTFLVPDIGRCDIKFMDCATHEK